MIPIRIFLPLDVLDTYIYAGYIFSVFKDGTLRTIPILNIYNKLARKHPEFKSIFQLALLRNDWLTNSQASTFYHLNGGLEEIKSAWNRCAQKKLKVSSNFFDEWKVLWEIPFMPIHDIRIYAMRIYLAHRHGVDEGYLNFDKKAILQSVNGLENIFDARTIFISARSGELMFSADNEGLFHGTLWNEGQKTKVTEKPHASKSLRTGWSGFDILNYDSHSHFSYLKNTTEKAETRTFRYSQQDEYPEKRRIIQIGTLVYDMKDMVYQESYDPSEISYSYNSRNTCFFILKDGRVSTRNFIKSQKIAARLSSREYSWPIFIEMNKDVKIDSRPYSAVIFPSGSVIELFNKVLLSHNKKITVLEKKPVISVRTFPTSIRFRRLICISREDGIVLHSVFPSDKEINLIKKN